MLLWIPFAQLATDDPEHGPGMEEIVNALPVYRSHRSVRDRSVGGLHTDDNHPIGAYVHVYRQDRTDQVAGPGEDLSIGGWLNEEVETIDLWDSVNEGSQNDADYVWVPAGDESELRMRLAPMEDPGTEDEHFFRYRYFITAVDETDAWTLTFGLYNGGDGSLIEEWQESDTGTMDAPVTAEHQIGPPPFPTAIADYENIQVRIKYEVALTSPRTSANPVLDKKLSGWVGHDGRINNLWALVADPADDDSIISKPSTDHTTPYQAWLAPIPNTGAVQRVLSVTDGLASFFRREDIDNPNLLVQSEDFTATEWSSNSCTVTPDTILAPDGNLTADLIDFSSAVGWIRQKSVTAFPAGTATHIETITPTADWERHEATINGFTASVYLKEHPTAVNNEVRLIAVENSDGSRELQIGSSISGASSVYAWGAQLESASEASQYRKTEDTAAGLISSWPDKSGLDEDIAQAVQASMPLAQLNDTTGLVEAYFDGTDDNLESGLWSVPLSGQVTVGLSYTPDQQVPTGSDDYIIGRSTAGGGRCAIIARTTDQHAIRSATILDDGVALQAGQRWVVVTFDGTDTTIRVNGNQTATGLDSSPISMGSIRLGNRDSGARAYAGFISDVVVYDRILDEDEIDALELYLSNTGNQDERKHYLESTWAKNSEGEVRLRAYHDTDLLGEFIRSSGDPLNTWVTTRTELDMSPIEGEVLWDKLWVEASIAGTTTPRTDLTPDSTPDQGDWNVFGGGTPHDAVSDGSDATYVWRDTDGGQPTIQFGFTFPGDQWPNTIQHELNVRLGTSVAAVTYNIELLKGATQIFLDAHITTTGASGWENYERILTQGEIDLLGDYSDVTVKITSTAVGAQGARVSQVDFTIFSNRILSVDSIFLDVPNLGRAAVSWVQLEAPSVLDSFGGDDASVYFGTKERLYEIIESFSKAGNVSKGAASPPSPTDTTSPYAQGTHNPPWWHFCSYGNHVIATNLVDPVQVRLDNGGAAGDPFEDLIVSTAKPRARFCAIVRNHLVLANLWDPTGAEVWGEADYVYHSAYNNIRDFDVATWSQCGYFPLRSTPGQITGLVGGDYGVIFKADSCHLLNWVGGNEVFRIDNLSRSVGCPAPKSIVNADGRIFFWGGDHFYEVNPQGEPWKVESQRVSNALRDRDFSDWAMHLRDDTLIPSEYEQIIGEYEPNSGLIFWWYRHVEDKRHRMQRAVVFNPTEGRWSYINQEWFSANDPDETVGISSLARGPSSMILGSSSELRSMILLGSNGQGTNVWWRLAAWNLQPSRFRTRIFALDQENSGGAYRINGIIPVYKIKGDSGPKDMQITLEISDDPRFSPRDGDDDWVPGDIVQTGIDYVDTQKYSIADADQTHSFPHDAAGRWARITVELPGMEGMMLTDMQGVFVDIIPQGDK